MTTFTFDYETASAADRMLFDFHYNAEMTKLVSVANWTMVGLLVEAQVKAVNMGLMAVEDSEALMFLLNEKV